MDFIIPEAVNWILAVVWISAFIVTGVAYLEAKDRGIDPGV